MNFYILMFLLIILIISLANWWEERRKSRGLEEELSMKSGMVRDLVLTIASQKSFPLPSRCFIYVKGEISPTPDDYAYKIEMEARWRYGYRRAFDSEPGEWSFNGGSFSIDDAEGNESLLHLVDWPWDSSILPAGVSERKATILVKVAFGDRSNIAEDYKPKSDNLLRKY